MKMKAVIAACLLTCISGCASRDLAKSNNGSVVEVRGRTIEIAELNGIFPNSSGEIDGRFWAGASATGRSLSSWRR